MKITPLNKRANLAPSKKLNVKYEQFVSVSAALEKVDMPDDLFAEINLMIDAINESQLSEKKYIKQLYLTQYKILKRVEEELNLVTKNHYLNLWVLLGMMVFGLPLGVIYGMMIDNMAFVGLGLSFGAPIGLVVGKMLDKKAFKEGRQLDVTL